MKKLCLFFVMLIQFTSANADICGNLYENLSNQLKKMIPSLTWVDINPLNVSTYCQFVIRYYPCNEIIQQQINQKLSNAIEKASNHCILLSQGAHENTEGYCTLNNIWAECS